MNNLNGVNIPYLDVHAIRKFADDFLANNWNDEIPIDIELIAEQKLNLNLTPLPGIKRRFGIDAFITIGGDEIIFDQDAANTRIRFSIAHEIGHLILSHHKKILENIKIACTEDWVLYTQDLPGVIKGKMEFQANEFAGRVLVPKSKLIEELKKFSNRIEKARNILHDDNDFNSINAYLAIPLSEKFEVSEECMFIRLKSEEINPFKILDEL